MQNAVGTVFKLRHGTAGCKDVYFDGVKSGVPVVYFDEQTPPTNQAVSLDGHAIEVEGQYYDGGIAQELFVETALTDPACLSVPNVTGKPQYTVVGRYKNEYWIHDPRFSLFENTVESPKEDGGGAVVKSTEPATHPQYMARCASAPMNFLNEENCFLSSDENVCASVEKNSGTIALTFTNFEKVHQASMATRYIYAVEGLRQDSSEAAVPYDSPCTPSARSRWVPVDDCSVDTPATDTSAAFAALISVSTDANPYLRDILFPLTGIACDPEDDDAYNFRVFVDGQCWQNVHQSHLQVFDFTAWVDEHPNGPAAIQQFAVPESFTLQFPSSHPMSRWYVDGKDFREDLGRLGDNVDPDSLPEVDAAFAAILVSPDVEGSGVVCGSPDEVANIAEKLGSFNRGAFDSATALNRTSTLFELSEQKSFVWMSVVMKGNDQLRQKIAWALSQLLVISPDALDVNHVTEMYLVS